MDVLFDELPPSRKQQALAEIEGCQACRREYAALASTLSTFDALGEGLTPPEAYWPKYEARLRGRLERDGSVGWFKQLSGWWTRFRIAPFTPLPIAACLLLIGLAVGFWRKPTRSALDAPATARRTAASPAPTARNQAPPQFASPQLAVKQIQPTKVKSRLSPPRSVQHEVATASEIAAGNDALQETGESPTLPETFEAGATRHFEQSQLLLRSFRNVRQGGTAPGAVDVSYERRLARSLLYRNVLLRREAEELGDAPAEEMLGTLEPLLLDIANLPAQPSADEVRVVKERLRSQDIVAALQVYAAPITSGVYPEN